MSVALAFALALFASAALTASWLWLVARVAGCHIPTADLLLIASLCSGLALLPNGWPLAIAIMSLLVIKATKAEVWPDAVLMVLGSGAIWLFAVSPFLNWALA